MDVVERGMATTSSIYRLMRRQLWNATEPTNIPIQRPSFTLRLGHSDKVRDSDRSARAVIWSPLPRSLIADGPVRGRHILEGLRVSLRHEKSRKEERNLTCLRRRNHSV